jgi:spore coat protein CotH
VKLRVVDNDARVGTAATVINAQPPPDGVPPTASAYVMPNQGWLPLTVQLSPFGSKDNEGVTTWKWDFDNDGTFETDATATQGYTSTTLTSSGVKTISLQVGDAEGNTSEASVTVSVLNMAQSTVDYAGAFPQSSVGRIDIELTQGNWDTMWADPQAEIEVPADITILGDFLPNIGLSMKGNSSLNGPGEKKPWKLDINDNDPLQEYRNMKELVLNNGFKDPSMLRERLSYNLLYNAGVPCSFATHVELWIRIGGNAPEFWGVYTMIERVDKKFLENRFFDDSGNLYKCEMGADLTWKGSDISAYPVKDGEPCYAKRTNETAADWSDVINLIDVINSTPQAQFPAAIESVFNVDGFLRYHAAMLSNCNFDIYMYMSQNYYLYNNPLTGKFEWIPWDQNEAWGLFGQQAAVKDHPLYEKTDIGMGGGHEAPLWDKVMAVPEYRQDLAAYLDLLRRSWFDYDTVRPKAQALHDLIEPSVDKGDKMEFPMSAFDSNWDTDYVPAGPGFPAFGIASFTQYRNGFVDDHLLADL